MLNIAITSNEPRARYFFDALRKKVNIVADVEFDSIDVVTKYLSAALSFKLPISEWWGNYQMHPFIQRKRRKNLQNGLYPYKDNLDALLMWGSWFHPFKNTNLKIPYYMYIDQSRSLVPTSDEPKTSVYGRRRSYELQVENYLQCAGILCMSEWAKKQTMESHDYLTNDKVHAIGWGPCSINLSNETPNFSEKKPIVLHISNAFHRKGLDFLFKVAANFNDMGKNIQFVVIGEDKRYTCNTKPNNVELIGKVCDRDILQKYFNDASVFFLPHRFDRNPHVLIEAMSAGLPIVASSQGGAIEVIENKGTGYLCPIGDINAYTKAILEIIESPKIIEAMGKSGQHLVRNFYNWDAIADRAINIMFNISLNKLQSYI